MIAKTLRSALDHEMISFCPGVSFVGWNAAADDVVAAFVCNVDHVGEVGVRVEDEIVVDPEKVLCSY